MDSEVRYHTGSVKESHKELSRTLRYSRKASGYLFVIIFSAWLIIGGNTLRWLVAILLVGGGIIGLLLIRMPGRIDGSESRWPNRKSTLGMSAEVFLGVLIIAFTEQDVLRLSQLGLGLIIFSVANLVDIIRSRLYFLIASEHCANRKLGSVIDVEFVTLLLVVVIGGIWASNNHDVVSRIDGIGVVIPITALSILIAGIWDSWRRRRLL